MTKVSIIVRINEFYHHKIWVVLFGLSFSLAGFAQWNGEIKGRVVDEKTGEPLPGAVISLVNEKTGTATDANGLFSIRPQSLPATIVVSYLGYKNAETVIDRYIAPLDISLAERVDFLDEVVVVGYGTQRRKELTGAISTVAKAHLDYNVAPSVDALLGGAVAGVNVTQSSGQPGAPASIRIRGGNSVNADNDPLYVIDGFLFFSKNSSQKVGFGSIEGESNPLNLLNPADIASIEVLKDVSATAIYGSRGSNGVILITTKRGGKAKTSVSYQYSAGFSRSAKKLDLLNAQQWARLQKDYFLNKPGYSDEQIAQLGEGYDWQNAVLQTGITHNHAISVSGGNEQTQYFVSANYLNQDGIILNSGFERFTGRINLNGKLSETVSFGINLTANNNIQNSLTTFEGVNYNSSPFSKGIANSLTYSLYIPPVVPFYNAAGNDYNYDNPFEYAYLREGNRTANPISDLRNSTANTENVVLLGNVYAQFSPFDGLTAKLNVGNNTGYTRQKYFSPSYTALGLEPRGIGGKGHKQIKVTLSEFTLTYTGQANDNHAFDVFAGATHEDTQIEFDGMQSAGFTDETLGADNLQDGQPYSKRPVFSGAENSNLYSLLGRINYSFRDKYHLTANFRSDYSSNFAKNHKWGFFPSVGLSWNVNEESFLRDIRSLSNLKLRVSGGSVGNQEIDSYLYLKTLEASHYGQQTVYSVKNYGNDDLKWETTTQYNLGVDAGFLNNRFSVTADGYYKKTSDLLLEIPPALGQAAGQMVNVGNVTNKGIEFSVNTVLFDNRKLHWSVAANISRNVNRITKLNGTEDIYPNSEEILRVGESLGSFYGLEFDGVAQKDEDVSALPTTPAYTILQPGDPKFVDHNPDNHINKDDRIVLGSRQPNFTFGISSNLKFKGFDLFVLFQGAQGNKVYNKLRRYLESPGDAYNVSAALLDAWTETNPSNSVPRITDVPLSSELDSRYIEDASYLRLKTLTIGYTLPFIRNKNIPKSRVFGTAQNLFTLSKYKGYNPEIASGIDLGAYPMPRAFYIGAELSF